MAKVGALEVDLSLDAGSLSDEVADALIDRLMPRLCERLRGRAPAEARGMAEAAAEVPGLDEVCLAALADWLEEQRLPGVAHEVRRLAIDDGDLLVFTMKQHLSREQRANLRASLEPIREDLASLGKRVVIIVLQPDMTIQQITTGKKKGG